MAIGAAGAIAGRLLLGWALARRRTDPSVPESVENPPEPARPRVVVLPELSAAPVRPPRPDPAMLTLAQRAVVHIERQGAVLPGDVAPFGLCQAGMGESLGVGQSALTKVLQRMVRGGVLLVSTRHVTGQARRLKVYELTPLGSSLARDIRRRHPELMRPHWESSPASREGSRSARPD